MKRRKCREHISLNTINIFLVALLSTSLPVLGLNTILTLLPAAIYGCTPPETVSETIETQVRIMDNTTKVLTDAESIDILIFNDDRMRRLDTYQRFGMTDCSTLKPSSSAGKKMMAAIVNSGKDRYGWADISSYDDLYRTYAVLEDETWEHMCMSGECSMTAGQPLNMQVRRLSAEVILRSISCDFTGKAYEGQKLKNARIYLINVNAETPILSEGPILPRRIINAGRLKDSDLEDFRTPDLLVQYFPEDIGEKVLRPDIRLRCYPNESEEESSGTPFTRLVIEGEIEGTTYYWPININRTDGGNGVSSNCRYIYDIRLRRLGSTDPDMPLEIMDAEIITEIKEWNEKEEYGVRF